MGRRAYDTKVKEMENLLPESRRTKGGKIDCWKDEIRVLEMHIPPGTVVAHSLKEMESRSLSPVMECMKCQSHLATPSYHI
jgi:hypothetical protein